MENIIKELDKFLKERNWGEGHTEANLAKSIIIEAAELLEHFQWNNDGFNKEEVLDELGDVMIYSLMMCSRMKISPEEVVLRKLEKVKKKYPVEK